MSTEPPDEDLDLQVDAEALYYREAYERLETRILAIPDEQCQSVRIDVSLVVRRVLALHEGIMVHRDSAARLPDFDIALFDDLQDIALALGLAHTRYLSAVKRDDRVTPRAQRVRELRDKLRLDAAALVARGLLPPKPRARVNRSRAYDRAPYELLKLVIRLREHWPAIEGRTAVTLAELDEAESAAGRLGWAVANRGDEPEDIRVATRIREQALSLLVSTYNEVRAAIQFLRRKVGDADTIAPSLYQGQRQRRAKAVAEDDATVLGASAGLEAEYGGTGQVETVPSHAGAGPSDR
jgi:hypothetical protein